MKQNELLMKHFENVGSISNMEAQSMYKIRALPRRVSDLEAKGYKFDRVRKTDLTGQRYVRYVYVRAD
jgi:hypothetical protein